jgi:hypothetical protein
MSALEDGRVIPVRFLRLYAVTVEEYEGIQK